MKSEVETFRFELDALQVYDSMTADPWNKNVMSFQALVAYITLSPGI